jgi:hypothetical protein
VSNKNRKMNMEITKYKSSAKPINTEANINSQTLEVEANHLLQVLQSMISGDLEEAHDGVKCKFLELLDQNIFKVVVALKHLSNHHDFNKEII